MSEIKLNPTLDLDLPFNPNSPEPQRDPVPPIYKESQPAVAPISNILPNNELVSATSVPVAQDMPAQSSDSSIDAINDSTKQIDTLMIVSFLLFLVSLGAAAYFLYQYFK